MGRVSAVPVAAMPAAMPCCRAHLPCAGVYLDAGVVHQYAQVDGLVGLHERQRPAHPPGLLRRAAGEEGEEEAFFKHGTLG